MAGLSLIAFGKQLPAGATQGNKLAVILNQPAHHYALDNLPATIASVREQLAGLGADSLGLRLNLQIVPFPRSLRGRA